MVRARFALAALLLVPTLASAQKKGMGGSKETDWNAVAGKNATGPTISVKDFENASPFKMLLDKKKDLKLTDAQMNSFKGSDMALKESNRARFELLDSLKHNVRPYTSMPPSAGEEARVVSAHKGLQSVARELQANFDSAAKTVLPMLDETQQPAAQKVLDKYNEEMRVLVEEKTRSKGFVGRVVRD